MGDKTVGQDDVDILWQKGIFDAHCHPTDTMGSIDEIPGMKAKVLTIMATRREDQDLVDAVASRFSLTSEEECEKTSSSLVIPAFGWHPWFSYQLFDDRTADEKVDVITHYKSVLNTKVEDEAFFRALPEPKSLSQFLAETEDRLKRHPLGLVGEVGLDKSFRLPKQWLPHDAEARDSPLTPGSREGRSLSPYRVHMEHQKVVLEAQLRLAAKLQRPVSIHSVQAHGSVLEVLQKLWSGHEKISNTQRKRRLSAVGTHAKEDDAGSCEASPSSLPFPPRVCMHSYSGPSDFLREFLNNKVPIDIYFSFSDVINFSGPSSEKVIDVVQAVPDSKILIESDLHTAGKEMDNRLGIAFQRICEIKKWSPEKGVQILDQNWRCFIFGA
jgi:Tat protein secretion system quality control protein TatD with DNase activity